MNLTIFAVHFNGRIQMVSESCKADLSYSGYCSSCGRNHIFSGEDCHSFVQSLMKLLTRWKCIDLNAPDNSNPQTLSTDPLFGQSRGKMFGVMKCRTVDGQTTWQKAFSGQFNGFWLVEGWVPPLFDVNEWACINTATELAIKKLSEEIQAFHDNPGQKRHLLQKRKELSRRLMKELHALYRLTNFRGRTISLTDIFSERTGIPTGTGDCCAPKLLNFAATNGLIPIGISEFYWGRENKSGNRQHRHIYLPCVEKCQPILGFMLCGLEEMYAQHRL
jgi:hypothetical protein